MAVVVVRFHGAASHSVNSFCVSHIPSGRSQCVLMSAVSVVWEVAFWWLCWLASMSLVVLDLFLVMLNGLCGILCGVVSHLRSGDEL